MTSYNDTFYPDTDHLPGVGITSYNEKGKILADD
jgi:hypothetical protein